MKAKAALPRMEKSAAEVRLAEPGFERDENADKTNGDSRPATPADLFSEQKRRERSHVNRSREPIGHDVGQRKRRNREIETEKLCGGEEDTRHLKARPLDFHEAGKAGSPDDRNKDDKRCGAADEDHLTLAIG